MASFNFNNLERTAYKKTVIAPGLYFVKEKITLERGCSYLYALVLKDNSDYCPVVSSELNPKFLHEFMRTDDIAAINAGFRFLCDDLSRIPRDFNYHCHIKNRLPLSLPDYPKHVLVQHNGSNRVELVKPKGWLAVNGKKIFWRGKHILAPINTQYAAMLFGATDIKLVKKTVGDRNIIVLGNGTMISAKSEKALVSFTNSNIETLTVASLLRRADLTKALFFLEIDSDESEKLKKGDVVEDWGIDKLNSSNTENAVTIGSPILESYEKTWGAYQAQLADITYNTEGEKFYGSRDTKQGRAVIIRIRSGGYVFCVFDARPKVEEEKGLTLKELSRIVYSKFDVDWAFQLDGGQSAKIVVKIGNNIKAFGNMHYRKYSGLSGESEWDGYKGRPVSSAIVLRKNV